MPNRKKLNQYIDKIYDSKWLTNNGPLVRDFTHRLKKHLGVKNLLLVANGTLALQIAYKTLNISGKVITTPFSFVATTSSLIWEGLTPHYVDINSETLCLDETQIENSILKNTVAILGVHVFGNSCNINDISRIASAHDLKVIYDGAHSFGINYGGKSILEYGDASTLSFHATKLFHSIEGGAIIFKNETLLKKAQQMINFGYDRGEIKSVGINAKMNEFQAAMGLCVLDEMDTILIERKGIWENYENKLKDHFQLQNWQSDNKNYSYFPIIFESEKKLLSAKNKLNDLGIFSRRYFHPSLNTLIYNNSQNFCQKSETISKRILCLPIFCGLPKNIQDLITTVCCRANSSNVNRFF